MIIILDYTNNNSIININNTIVKAILLKD